MQFFRPLAFATALLLVRCAPLPPPPSGAPAGPQSCNCSITSIIFFDPGVATVTAKNLSAVRSVEKTYAQQVQHPILIAGGADSAEIAASPTISLQRAESVAAQLETDGIPAQNIIVRDNGARHLMIPTGPGIPQIMNRYVMVSVQLDPLTPGAGAPGAAAPYQMRSIALYQPNAVLVDRLGPDGAHPLAAYIAGINTAIAPLFALVPAEPGISGAVVVGVKPGGAVRVWLVAPPGALPPALTAQIQSVVQALQPPVVQNGPIAFAILFNAWGGGAPITNPQHQVPMPPEWYTGAAAPQSVPDGVFARIWP